MNNNIIELFKEALETEKLAYKLYSEILKITNDKEVIKTATLIKKQEEYHIKNIQEILKILRK